MKHRLLIHGDCHSVKGLEQAIARNTYTHGTLKRACVVEVTGFLYPLNAFKLTVLQQSRI